MAYSQELYQQVILDHNKNPRNFREIEGVSHKCDGRNPLCGDTITVFLSLGEGGYVADVSFKGSGCAISKASASLMTTFVKGKKLEDVRIIFEEFHKMVKGDLNPESQDNHLGKLKLFQGVKDYPARVKCASLAWHALVCALDKKQEISTEAAPGGVKIKDSLEVMDLTGVKCPLNFVKVKVQLSKMNEGEQLKVILDDGDPIQNVPKSLEMEEQPVLAREQLENGQWSIVVEKKGE